MNNLRKAAEMALKWMEATHHTAMTTYSDEGYEEHRKVEKELRQALAQPEQPEALLTFSEVQATITMSRSFVYKEIAEGRINPIKIGKSIRFAKSEIDKWVLSQMAAR